MTPAQEALLARERERMAEPGYRDTLLPTPSYMRPAMPTCAYPQCQAGGVILEGAPMVVDEYHPGCWAAEQRER